MRTLQSLRQRGRWRTAWWRREGRGRRISQPPTSSRCICMKDCVIGRWFHMYYVSVLVDAACTLASFPYHLCGLGTSLHVNNSAWQENRLLCNAKSLLISLLPSLSYLPLPPPTGITVPSRGVQPSRPGSHPRPSPLLQSPGVPQKEHNRPQGHQTCCKAAGTQVSMEVVVILLASQLPP